MARSNTTVLTRCSDRGRIPAATAAAWRERAVSRVTTDARHRTKLPRTADRRPRADLADRVPIDSDAIVILEVFEKKSRKTPRHVLDTCKRRLRAIPKPHEGELMTKAEKRRKLEAAGWRFGETRDFLGLSSSEAEFVEIKL